MRNKFGKPSLTGKEKNVKFWVKSHPKSILIIRWILRRSRLRELLTNKNRQRNRVKLFKSRKNTQSRKEWWQSRRLWVTSKSPSIGWIHKQWASVRMTLTWPKTRRWTRTSSRTKKTQTCHQRWATTWNCLLTTENLTKALLKTHTQDGTQMPTQLQAFTTLIILNQSQLQTGVWATKISHSTRIWTIQAFWRVKIYKANNWIQTDPKHLCFKTQWFRLLSNKTKIRPRRERRSLQ